MCFLVTRRLAKADKSKRNSTEKMLRGTFPGNQKLATANKSKRYTELRPRI